MTTRPHATPNSSRATLTVGELVAAAYELSPGSGRERAERAARLLADTALARRWSRPIRFVR
jgi:hypothetical protein